MNLLARNIAIWYKDIEWASKLANEIIDHLPRNSIYYLKGSDRFCIDLRDGTRIQFIHVSDGVRGYALTDSYVQYGIDSEFIECRVCAMTKTGTQGVYTIRKYEDFLHPVRYRKE